MESKEARAALDVVAEAEAQAEAPGNAGFAALTAVLFGLGITVAVVDLIWWTLGVMAALIACLIVWFFRRPGVRLRPATGGYLQWRRSAASLARVPSGNGVPVANLLPPLWWLAVPAGVAIAAMIWRVAMKYQDVYFR
jgi:hypothetical protein